MNFNDLSTEQQLFCNTALTGQNIRVEACIGSGKTTAIQALCDMFPKNKLILYLTYNKLLKADAKAKIKNSNVTVTNYHGFVYPYLVRNGIRCSISDSIRTFTKNRLSIPRYDIIIIDEYQDIELDFAEMLEYVKSTNPNMQIIMVGDMSQKIYDKTTLDVANWSQTYLGTHVELEFTKCFRLQAELAAKLGRIWGKTITGVNQNCKVSVMGKSQVVAKLSSHKPGDILCLGSKTGPMVDVLNQLEENYPDKFNKRTVYASIKDGEANIEPNDSTAIFTTFDSSKGMEKPVCVVFDWDEAYWTMRTRQAGADGDILRNIFCVAASRGKQEIIFVQSVKHNKAIELLSEETLMTPIEQKQHTDVYVDTMFDFKFVEEIDKAYHMLDITRINAATDEINIDDVDGYIDLSPCLREYQKAVYFKNYDIDSEIVYAFSQTELKIMPDLSLFPVENKLLYLVSLLTKQNRYQNQVRLPLVTPVQHNSLIDRLSEKVSRDERVQVEKCFNLNGIIVHSKCDVLRDNSVWQIEYRQALRPEDYLRAAMYAIIFDKPEAILWNTRNNEMLRVSVDSSKRDAFCTQVYRIITKMKSSVLPSNMNNDSKSSNYLSEELDKRRTSKSESVSYSKNDRVEHLTFGKGLVIAVRNMTGYQILTIEFDKAGTKKIATGSACITKLPKSRGIRL